MKELDSITWFAPSKCSKRDSGIQGNMEDKQVTLSLEQPMVKLASAEEPPVVDTSPGELATSMGIAEKWTGFRSVCLD